ncbi:MAG: rhodanese-like domain-containing protein [Thiotrichales bacterium]|jgi:rhodanese-related sulfurtransferase|nr:rhodanese-like domain-containing protein [Pseudomonadota bacterium]MCI4410801.1 rhodanese-like domain-containing protein [Thiotrichales bacterium]
MFISCEETKKLLSERNAQFVDVRTPEEFESSKLPGAVNIPLHIIEAVCDQNLDKTRPVVVFCRSGQRSQMALQILKSKGFPEVYNMGSFMAWNQC